LCRTALAVLHAEVNSMISPPRGVFTMDSQNFNTYLLPGDVAEHWTEQEQLEYLTQIQEQATHRHGGDMKAAFEEWAVTADPDETEMGRKVMWEWAHIKV
jgi:hypothetical protein